MTELVKIEPVDEVAETVVVEIKAPSNPPEPPARPKPIRRGVPLKETHGMTTEANRFKET